MTDSNDADTSNTVDTAAANTANDTVAANTTIDAAAHTVITECDLPHAPDKVWRALTAPDLLAQWLPDAVDCKVLATERPRLLCYHWKARDDDAPDSSSVVSFELTGTDAGGTHLRVVHRVTSATLLAFQPRRAAKTQASAAVHSVRALPMVRCEPAALRRAA